MREELTFAGDHQGVALVADADPVHHPPELFEVQFANEPFPAVGVVHADGDDGRGQEIIVKAKRDMSAPSTLTLSEPGTLARDVPIALDTTGWPVSSRMSVR